MLRAGLCGLLQIVGEGRTEFLCRFTTLPTFAKAAITVAGTGGSAPWARVCQIPRCEVPRMSLEDLDRSLPDAASASDVIHRRWLLSKRAEDGRPLLVREDRVVYPTGFTTRQGGSTAMEAAEMSRTTLH
jgi:hypothetical protein